MIPLTWAKSGTTELDFNMSESSSLASTLLLGKPDAHLPVSLHRACFDIRACPRTCLPWQNQLLTPPQVKPHSWLNYQLLRLCSASRFQSSSSAQLAQFAVVLTWWWITILICTVHSRINLCHLSQYYIVTLCVYVCLQCYSILAFKMVAGFYAMCPHGGHLIPWYSEKQGHSIPTNTAGRVKQAFTHQGWRRSF